MKLCWTDNYIPSSSRPKWRWLSRPGRRLKILCWSLFKSRNSTFANVGCLSFENFCVILQLEAEHFCRSLRIKLWKSVNICEGNLDWDHADFLEVFQVLIDLPRHTPPCQSLWLWKFSIFNQQVLINLAHHAVLYGIFSIFIVKILTNVKFFFSKKTSDRQSLRQLNSTLNPTPSPSHRQSATTYNSLKIASIFKCNFYILYLR